MSPERNLSHTREQKSWGTVRNGVPITKTFQSKRGITPTGEKKGTEERKELKECQKN